MTLHYLDQCLACGGRNLYGDLYLGKQPPANLLLKSPDDYFPQYPLMFNMCRDCSHGQLAFILDREDLFGSDYKYASGTSYTLNNYFQSFANCIAQITPPNSRILEIASNDGSLLKKLGEKDLQCYGIEPSESLAKNYNGTVGFWPDTEHKVNGYFNIIIGLNVLAHVSDPLEFLSVAKKRLATGGLIIIQTSQGDLLESYQFDSIYAEHFSYFNRKSMTVLADRAGLRLDAAYRMNIHGLSDIWVLSDPQIKCPLLSAPFEGSPWFIDHTPNLKDNFFVEFYFRNLKRKLQEITDYIKLRKQECFSKNRPFVLLGCAAKAQTVLNAAGVIPDFVLDESPLKIGSWAPGWNHMVMSLKSIKDIDNPLVVIGAWNFADELIEKVKSIRYDPIEFCQYFPIIKRQTI